MDSFSNMDFPDCRHSRAGGRADVLRCASPKLVGLGEVTADFCQRCHFRDHADLVAAFDHGLRLLQCAHAGDPLERGNGRASNGDARFACRHPDHEFASARRCAECADYLYPLVTPQTPVEDVCRIIAQGPREQHDDWAQWPNVQEAHRQHASAFIASIPPQPDINPQRGVVVVGGGKYFVSAFVTIRVLRHVGCRLPIELWHLAGEMDDAMRTLLAPYGVRCIDADDVARGEPYRFLHGHWWKGWQLKAFALRHCLFGEVLLLDADCYPVRNPEFLFDWPEYREFGAVFWPDPEGIHDLFPNHTWDIFGAQSQGDQTTESGQLLVNKRICWREVNLAAHYNSHADFVYRLIWGDKDTFPLAWRRLGRNYARTWPIATFHALAMRQYDQHGEVIFQHRMNDKFRLSGESFQSSPQWLSENHYAPELAHEDFCHNVVDELKARWIL